MSNILPTLQQGYDWSAAELVGAMKLNIGTDAIMSALTSADDPRTVVPGLLAPVNDEHSLMEARVNHPTALTSMTQEERVGAWRIHCLLRDAMSDITSFVMEWSLRNPAS